MTLFNNLWETVALRGFMTCRRCPQPGPKTQFFDALDAHCMAPREISSESCTPFPVPFTLPCTEYELTLGETSASPAVGIGKKSPVHKAGPALEVGAPAELSETQRVPEVKECTSP